MPSVWRLLLPPRVPLGLLLLLLPTTPLLGQANIPQWSPHRPAPAPLAPAATAPLPLHEPSGAPQWVLVRNRDLSTGLPPYALADSTGKLVRYVEPSPGIPIEDYLGQAVEVRHDTGRVLLASQLMVVRPQTTTPVNKVALAEFRSGPGTAPSFDASRNDQRGRPIERAEQMAQQILGDHQVVQDRGPIESLFDWAGGKRLGRFISIGEPRPGDSPATRQRPSSEAQRHTTASGVQSPPIGW